MQLVIGLFALVVILTLLAARFEAITHTTKMRLIKAALLIFALLWLYESSVDRHDEKIRALYLAFKQGKPILCDDKPISQKAFFFETGTESFISLGDDGIVYPADSCEVKGD